MSNTLVAYFSASGVTERVAKELASTIGADLHQILPQEPYSAADLDWTNSQSRSSIEMTNKQLRPAVANTVGDMDAYDTIYLGFPIWWYVAPTIINTFLEGYDLAGKTIVPFATSGSSAYGDSTNAELALSCPGATLVAGTRFAADVTATELKAWAE